MAPQNGHVFWLCGLSGAGKSTLANALIADLRGRGTPVLALDGDALRDGVSRGLGFSAGDRAENLRRAAGIARLGADSHLCTVAAFITPLEANRAMIAAIVGRSALSLVFVDAPLAICQQRDVKGLYLRERQGGVPQMTGMSSPFERPTNADLVIRSAEETSAASTMRLVEFAAARLGSTHG